jgi:uncharacterized OsmC-like protein
MATSEKIKQRFERNARAVKLRPSVGQYTSKTSVRMREGLTCEIEDGPWSLLADLGEKSGGESAGPTPGTYGRAAIGSCLAMACLQWAAKRDVAIEGIEIEVETDADEAGAYGVADVPAGYAQVRCSVTVRSSAPQAQVRSVVDEATRHCLFWDVFERAIDLKRELRILAPDS